MDNDVKIFGEPMQDGEDLDSVAAATELLRRSGNLDRAKRLGRDLAKYTSQHPKIQALLQNAMVTLVPQQELQLHVLMVFSGQKALRAQLEPQLLAEAAVTAMNNYLINHEKAFWDTISDGTVFTQYLLGCPQPGVAAAQQAGFVFARLCGQEDNPDLQGLGEAVFLAAHNLVGLQWEN